MIYFRELLISAGTRTVSRFVSENEQGESDINTVSSSHVETVCLLGNRKPDTTVKLSVDMDDYYRIINGKDEE